MGPSGGKGEIWGQLFNYNFVTSYLFLLLFLGKFCYYPGLGLG